MTIRRVLKPFRFSRPPAKGNVVAPEIHFAPGDVDIADDILDHPWMKAGADGALETHEATMSRTQAAKVHADNQAAIAKKANEDAQAAVDRLVAAHGTTEEQRKAVEDQMNTPIGKLREQSADAKLDMSNMTPAQIAELNTPISALKTPGLTGEQSAEQAAGAAPDGGSNLPDSPTTADVTGSGELPNAGAPPPEARPSRAKAK